MKLKIDREADALYFRLDDSTIVESEEVSPGVVLDFTAQNQVVGVEMLNVSKRAPNLTRVPLEQGWMYYRALQQSGKTEVRFIIFTGEGHDGPRKLSNQRRLLNEEMAWLDKYLLQHGLQ